MALLIASLAFHGTLLAEAKLGILSAAFCASALTWTLFRLTRLLPKRLKLRALLGTSTLITDLAVPVDPDRDHIRGPEQAPVTVVEYGDFECPYCGQAEPIVRELLSDFGDVRYVFRHLPLNDVHPHAQLAAEGAEAADRQGKFWEMHDLLMEHQGALTARDLIQYAADLGLNTARFTDDLRKHAGAARVAEDVDSADLSAVSGTPTFFINGKRHYGAYDIGTLSDAVRAARVRSPDHDLRRPARGPGQHGGPGTASGAGLQLGPVQLLAWASKRKVSVLALEEEADRVPGPVEAVGPADLAARVRSHGQPGR